MKFLLLFIVLALVAIGLVTLTVSAGRARLRANRYQRAFEKAQDGLLMIESKSSDAYASNLAAVYKSEARQMVGLPNEL
jgi:hypothetical protein